MVYAIVFVGVSSECVAPKDNTAFIFFYYFWLCTLRVCVESSDLSLVESLHMVGALLIVCVLNLIVVVRCVCVSCTL